ncbi:MAG: DUF5811 family protein [Halobacteriaceae archaeon]
MNGNTPYAGVDGRVEPGARAPEDRPELTTDQRRVLQRGVASIAARTRDLLPAEYAVGGEISRGVEGPEVMIAVRPPIGNPVSAGFQPEFDEGEPDPIPQDDRAEVARGLAASAALQVKQALDGDVPPTAK